ncbi:hypothetical protein RDWZM_010371, partial [Blomia tropicalis]
NFSYQGDVAKALEKKHITPRHLTLAVRKDEELNELLFDVILSGGGVPPKI